MSQEFLQALEDWCHAITAAAQEANPGHDRVLSAAMHKLHDEIENEKVRHEQ